MKQRIDSIDVAKGILLVMVVFSHGCGFLFFGGILTACYMSAFFVLAGYTHNPENHDYITLLKRRSKALLLPYICWNGVIIGIRSICAIQAGSFSARWLLKNIGGAIYSRYCLYPLGSDPNTFFLDTNGAMWFITAFFSSYVIFYASLWLISQDSQDEMANRKILVPACLLAMAVLLSYCPILLPWSIDTAFIGAFFMLAGYMVREWQASRQAKLNCIDRYMLLLAVGTFYIMLQKCNPSINMSVRVYGNHGCWSVLLFAAIGVTGSLLYAACGTLISKVKPLRVIFLTISKNAIPLMALQFEVFLFLDRVMPVLNFSNQYMAYGYGATKAVLNVFICVMVGTMVTTVKNLRITK